MSGVVYVLVLLVHVVISVILITVILLQGGRGGLSESLSGSTAQSLFGGGAVTALTRITAMCASLFVLTCLSLAYLSTMRGRSVIEQVPMVSPESLPMVPGGAPEPANKPSAAPSPAAAPSATNAQPAATAGPAQSAPVHAAPSQEPGAPSGDAQHGQP